MFIFMFVLLMVSNAGSFTFLVAMNRLLATLHIQYMQWYGIDDLFNSLSETIHKDGLLICWDCHYQFITHATIFELGEFVNDAEK